MNFVKIKKGAIGEGIMTIYRLVLVSFIALIVLGISSVFYYHYIDVRDSEAIILVRNVADCFSSGVKIDNFNNGILRECGLNNDGRLFIDVTFFDSSGKKIKELTDGDSGSVWVKKIFEDKKKTEDIKQYEPGYFNGTYPFYDFTKNQKLNMLIEVYVNEE